MRVGIVQFHPVFGGVARNIARAIALARTASADLWILPELFTTGYQFRDRDEVAHLAEGLDGPSMATMATKAAELGTWFCGGFAERDGDKLFNSAFLVGPDGNAMVYRKVHLFDREKELFDQGDRGFVVVDVSGAKVGMMICFDWLFPESARTLALMGAQVIAHPSNLVLPHCPEAMKTRALENRVFTFTANRIGHEDRLGDGGLTYIGSSVAYAPDGRRLISAGREDECAAVVEVDPALALDKSMTRRNDVLADRRVDAYRLGRRC